MARPDIALSTPLSTQAASANKRRGFFSASNPWLWVSPAVGILLLYSVFPLVFNILVSFQNFRTSTKAWEWVGFRNYEWMLYGNPLVKDFGNAIVITAVYTIVALTVQLLLGLFIALLLDARPWFSNIMQTLMILPMVTAPVIAGLMFRLLQHPDFGVISWLLYGVGALDKSEPLLGGTGQYALIALLIVEIWQWTPFFVLIILAGLKGLPHEIVEASQVDGASWLQRLTRIKIPMLFSVITVGVLFRLIELYKTFDYVMVMTSGGPGDRTTTLSFYQYTVTFQNVRWGYGAAIGVFIMVVGWLSAFAYTKIFRVKW
ncbi:MAG: sugar ABC transporter permease [Chloroflexi bacterium CFX4]|nr:sugar ABC transporter permease [Chloroflexi bacterium CFX4]MDL1921725.1 sugar ABC transporter permease [Chloroflexi bacterium CFX3]